MKRLAFFIYRFDIRGVSVATYDYAHYNEILLNNKSIIFVPSWIDNHNEDIKKKFCSRFEVVYYLDNSEISLDDTLEKYNIDLLYVLKYGKMYGEHDVRLSMRFKTAIHCVFDMSEPHGDVYAGVSYSIAKKYNKKLFVPHMISLEPDFSKSFRKDLNIPDDGIVFGRYGGEDTFNLEFCRKAIVHLVHQRNDIYFLFANTPVFFAHPRIIHIDMVRSDIEKNKFINTCDAHLECGNMGHSFGLAIAEFSIHNKPIIAYRVGNDFFWNDEHIRILGDKGIYFESEIDFFDILNKWNKKDWINRDLNCYREYTPEKVMKIFKEVFID